MAAFRPDRDLLSALAALPTRPWTGIVWRHTFAGYPPEKTNIRGARWNPPGVEALYVSVDRQTALAEAEHQLAVQPLRPKATRTLHRMCVRVGRLMDLSSQGLLHSLGITDEGLHGDAFVACQEIGGAAAYLEVDGLLVPSVRAQGPNLVILFVDAEPSPSFEVLDSELIS